MIISRGLALLLWVFLIQLAGIYLFTGGFLLTRLALSESTTCTAQPCSLPATHKRAVILIIDALRFDFVSPEPPIPASPFHHNVLTLPRELTELHPMRSFLFNAYADPPTTTLQRIKGLTTGSLPTFVDIGNNFGGSSIAEDSLLLQLNAAGKKVRFFLPSRCILCECLARLPSWETTHGCLCSLIRSTLICRSLMTLSMSRIYTQSMKA